MEARITLTTGKPIMTLHTEAKDIFALARRGNISPLRIFAQAYDLYQPQNTTVIDDYSSFRANGIIPSYVRDFVEVENESLEASEQIVKDA